ncbi:MAG: ABC transporter ATP-binding protein [Gammaproteobacteria bacterium]|nr:ABC transporter ATP-binding protein [Gammaproteobacteria bacterium]
MIKIEHLSKNFGHLVAVEDISFSVGSGEVLGFLGPNGAGKSTTMKMITGFLAPSSGEIEVCGFNVSEHPIDAKKRIGYLPEGAPSYPEMTPLQFLDFIAEIRGLSGQKKIERKKEVIELLHLDKVLHQSIETLSKGFKRRVGLAQAILHDPEILILDEPMDGLDPNQKHEVKELIKSIAPEKVIVISTHILEEVEAICTRAIIIADGKILVDDTPGGLRDKFSGNTLDDVFREITRAKLT